MWRFFMINIWGFLLGFSIYQGDWLLTGVSGVWIALHVYEHYRDEKRRKKHEEHLKELDR